MIKFWATKVKYNLATIDDVPDRYLDSVKRELGITS